MKRLIALLLVAVFCIMIFSPPVSAICPNPNDSRFVRGGTPYGDEGGWNDITSPGEERAAYIDNLKFVLIKYFIICPIIKRVEQRDVREGKGYRTDDRDTGRVPHSLLWDQ